MKSFRRALALLLIAVTVGFVPAIADDLNEIEYAEWKEQFVSSKDNSSDSELYEDEYTYLRNNYIEVCINNNGRYTIGTTGGNIDNSDDDHKKLLYGHPGSGTTETLIEIDDAEVFFSSNNTTINSDGTQAVSVENYNGVEIKQILSIETNTYTGNADVVSIKYVLTNNTSSSKQLGGRIMLDTMLGSNDGAPFRLPNIGNVTKEMEFSGNQIPEYWQAFDSLTDPKVISTGNFYRTESERPDKVQFAYWWGIRGSSWNYSIDAQRSLTGDSAVAAYFNPRTVLPGQSRTIVTYYGISDFSQSDVGGDVSLRVTSPSSLEKSNEGYLNNPFFATLYIANNTNETIENLKARIVLPDELEIEGSDFSIKRIGNVSSGTEISTKWTIRAIPQGSAKTVTYKIVVSGDNIETKEISLNIRLAATNNLYRTISFDLNGGDGATPKPQRVLIGTKGAEPTRPTRDRYVFKGWYANPDCTGVSWFSFFNVGALLRTNENITLYAKWQRIRPIRNDLYSFSNYYDDFHSTYRMSSEYFDILTDGLSNSKKTSLRKKMQAKWDGSCYGMGVTEALMILGEIDPEFFKGTEDQVRYASDFDSPRENSKVESLVNFYQLSQFLDGPSSQKRTKKTQSELLEELVQKTESGNLVCICVGRYASAERQGGHALIAYDIEILEDGNYKVLIFESNCRDLTSSYMIITPDYNDATFHCSWGTNYNGLKLSNGTMKIDSITTVSTYCPINLQNELIKRGNEVAPFALLASDTDYDMIKTSYDSVIIENGEGLRTVITDGVIESDELNIEDTQTNENGTEFYWYLNLNDSYKITAKDCDQDEYTTEILFADEEYINIITKEVSDISVSKGSTVEISGNAVNDISVTIATELTDFDSWGITNKTDHMSIAIGDEMYVINSNTGFDEATVSITSGDSINTIDILTEDTQISVTPKNNNGTPFLDINDSETNTLGSVELEYNVYFYTYGGTAVADILNVVSGSTISKPNDPRYEGFIFGGWYKTSECNDTDEWNFDEDIVEDNTILHAKWVTDENYLHRITFKSENNDDIIVLVRNGESLTDIPAVPEKNGYTGQWDVTDFNNITSNMIVNAVYSSNNNVDIAEKPIANPVGGTYSTKQTVSLTTVTQDAKIYYTLDGSTPSTDSTLYTKPIKVSSSLSIKAIAVKDGAASHSEIMEEVYVIKKVVEPSSPSHSTGSRLFTISFDSNGGSKTESMHARAGETISEPAAPVKEGYVFVGWYTDAKLKTKYDFSSVITQKLTLFAKWEADPEAQIILTIGEKEAIVFGKKVKNDVAPKLVNSRTMLPIRFVAEALGANVAWNEKDPDKVMIEKDDVEIVIYIGSNIATINGVSKKLDSPAFLENDRTYLPLRFVSENLGADVDWVDETQQVIITKIS